MTMADVKQTCIILMKMKQKEKDDEK